MGRDGQVSALALVSEELRRARSAAGLTQDQLAERVGYSPSLVAHVETGSRAPSLDFARRGGPGSCSRSCRPVWARAGLAGQFAIAGFDGPPDVVYLDNALARQVVERPGDVARVALLYDILKAEALSPRASADLARKAIERWT
jgi:DNA-binding XRE family transcriptional regulator